MTRGAKENGFGRQSLPLRTGRESVGKIYNPSDFACRILEFSYMVQMHTNMARLLLLVELSSITPIEKK